MINKIKEYCQENIKNHNFQVFDDEVCFYIDNNLCTYNASSKELFIEICETMFLEELQYVTLHFQEIDKIIKNKD